MDDPDSIDTRISSECPVGVQAILRAARRHDRAALKDLLDGPGKASCRDPVTGETPLHAAVRGAGARVQNGGDAAAAASPSDAARVVEQLLFSGAIWNDVDDQNETPGCVAWRLHQTELYEILVRAGTRAEMLFAVLDGYEALGSDGAEEEEDEEDGEEAVEEEGAEGKDDADTTEQSADPTEEEPTQPEQRQPAPEAYLDSRLTLEDGKLVDAAGNGVMMEWETDIMRRSVDALLGPADAADDAAVAAEGATEKRVLNIGFGLGIIDSLLAARRPARHHIIEAHPDVLARIDRHSAAAASAPPSSSAPAATSSDHAAEFGAAWEAAGRTPGAHRVWRGRWQDVCPRLLAEGELYDAIYFDTFGEDYAALRRFFVDYLPGLLADGGVFGFFNGLGADRRICYDVYTHVVEMHLAEAGLDVAWQTVDVPLAAEKLDAAGQGAWAGIVRPYWTLDQYRLPICTFLG